VAPAGVQWQAAEKAVTKILFLKEVGISSAAERLSAFKEELSCLKSVESILSNTTKMGFLTQSRCFRI
jgi:hypothetical protein